MKILIVDTSVIPVNLYGGTQRVIWGLGKELVKMGHKVSFLVKQGSYSNFALEYMKKYEKVISGETLNAYSSKLLKLQKQKWLDWK